MKTKAALLLPVLSLGLLASGCGDDTPRTAWIPATLTQAESCEHLLQMLREDSLAKMHGAINGQIASIENRDDWGGMMRSSSDDAAAAPPQSSGTAETDASPDHSDTNVQVEGVDEADIVKTDGNYLYILHGRNLAIVRAWPASGLALESSTPIEGQPQEMFVTEDKVVVYSHVDGAQIFQDAGLPPYADPYGYGYDYAYYPTVTKITVLDLVGTEASVALEYYAEGSYRSARRVGSQVRSVVSGNNYYQVWQSYPTSGDYGSSDDDQIDALETLRDQNAARIAAATLDSFLARRIVRSGAQLEVLAPSCTDHHMPTPGSTQYGITQLLAIDLGNLGAGVHETQVVGAVQTIYANADAMYLAGEHWAQTSWLSDPPDDPISMTATHVHKFDVQADPARPRYVSSGSIPGVVHNQFSLDERDGLLRVATTDRLVAANGGGNVNNVYVMDHASPIMKLVGGIAGLAPGETIQSARFVGDRGYIVTFRQVDPLFVIDLSNPSAPQLLGELKIPGFSEYMHPIEDGQFLLTIGRDGNDMGTTGNPALQIFDVREPTNPVLLHKHELPDGSSEAEMNHKAFTYYQDMLAIPLSRYSSSWQATLELFRIDGEQGITPLGSINHASFLNTLGSDGYCGPYEVGVRRGVFIENLIYSISNGGVVVNEVSDPSAAVATLVMPEISSYDCQGY